MVCQICAVLEVRVCNVNTQYLVAHSVSARLDTQDILLLANWDAALNGSKAPRRDSHISEYSA